MATSSVQDCALSPGEMVAERWVRFECPHCGHPYDLRVNTELKLFPGGRFECGNCDNGSTIITVPIDAGYHRFVPKKAA